MRKGHPRVAFVFVGPGPGGAWSSLNATAQLTTAAMALLLAAGPGKTAASAGWRYGKSEGLRRPPAFAATLCRYTLDFQSGAVRRACRHREARFAARTPVRKFAGSGLPAAWDLIMATPFTGAGRPAASAAVPPAGSPRHAQHCRAGCVQGPGWPRQVRTGQRQGGG